MNTPTDDMPEEDRYLQGKSQPIYKPCVHEWCDFYYGSGLSKRDKRLLNVWMFCKKCLAKRQMRLDISDNDWKDDEEDA